MSLFEMYYKLGVEHITDIKGYDHIVFLIALCAGYVWKEWKNILILITAFTLGHTLTLALATLDLVRVSGDLIEFLIPLTIFITATFNLYELWKGKRQKKKYGLKYSLALFFGLIHGLGFSNYLRSLLDSASSLVKPLFAFNLGVEAGQLIIVSVIFILSTLVLSLRKIKLAHWSSLLSLSAGSIALYLMIGRYPF